MFLYRILHISFAMVFSAVLLAASPSRAAEFKEFDASAFAAAESQGRPVLLDVSAWWCPVCASQNATIKQTVGAAAYAKLLILHIDFDRQEAIWRGFDVVKQATLIGFKGKREVGRLEFVTDKDQIKSLLNTVVS
jgi:thioredoxin-like negative regulator of GroEL